MSPLCFFFFDFNVSVFYRYGDIQRVWPWNVGKGSFKVIEVVLLDRSRTNSYSSSSIVTMAVFCIVFGIKRCIGRKTFLSHVRFILSVRSPVTP